MALTLTFMLLKKQQQQQLLLLLNKDSIFIRASLSSTSTSSTSLYLNFNPNGQLFQSSLRYVDRRRRKQVVFHMHGSSLSLSRLHHSPPHCTLHRLNCQVPHLMSHPPPLSLLCPLQEKLQTFFLAPPNPPPSPSSPPPPPPPTTTTITTHRGLCSRVSNGDSDSETTDVENCESVQCENVNSMADWKEVDRVCKVVDELFALDQNMEAVLDELVERFRHARRPAFRFFCWVGQRSRPGYSHDSRTYNKMMLILGKARQFETMVIRKKAVGIFELMKKYKFKVGVDTIDCLLESLRRAKLGKEAQLLTYTVLLNGWCRVKNLMEEGKVWNDMIDKGFKPNIVAHHTMLEGLLRCRKRSNAIKLFEVMKSKGPYPSARSYTILIRDLCKQMKMREAVEYFEDMLDYGYKPDAAVYTCLITGFGNQKKMDKVYGFGFQPTIHTYNMMMKSYF
ncbi:hypothetical protein CsSME_00048237 [Camellia sinensis var. sinensis]